MIRRFAAPDVPLHMGAALCQTHATVSRDGQAPRAPSVWYEQYVIHNNHNKIKSFLCVDFFFLKEIDRMSGFLAHPSLSLSVCLSFCLSILLLSFSNVSLFLLV